MPTLDDSFEAVQTALLDHFGPPPTEFEGLDPFEAMVAVLLHRATGRTGSNAGLEGLGDDGLLTPEGLAKAEIPEIMDAIHGHGVSAPARSIAPLRQLARWLVDHHEARVDSLFDPHRSADTLRGELAGLNGISVSGADALILYALKKPSYPVDRATFRVLVRHDWLEPTATYEEARDLIVDHALKEADLRERDAASVLAELAHGMQQLGRRFCRTARPLCDGCPLEPVLPEGGAREIDG
jgi:endonuclease III related protein